MTFNRTDILLPKFSHDKDLMKKWSIVACDQYTSEPDYWNEVSKLVEDNYSALNLIIPEIYLNDADIDSRIKNANLNMNKYIDVGIFTEHKNTYIYVERTLKNGVKRLGIVGAVDLEEYDYQKGSQTKIRATEGTVLSRIPPRLKVRQDALIELPHIMMLIDDIDCDIIEYNEAIKSSFETVYDFDLAMDSGHITGYKMSKDACDLLDEKLHKLDSVDAFNKKYGVNMEHPLIFAMGDGNHSLATAKTYYENLKKEIGEAAKESPARFALCELVNLHDKSLEFEAIHRVVFNFDGNVFLKALEEKYDISYADDAKGQAFVYVYGGEKKKVTVLNPNEYLTVATVQNLLDELTKDNDSEIDYIHGEDVVCKLCENKSNFGIIFDAMKKTDLYKSVIMDGALPRKTFSMGEACDKRFYIEARKIK